MSGVLTVLYLLNIVEDGCCAKCPVLTDRPIVLGLELSFEGSIEEWGHHIWLQRI